MVWDVRSTQTFERHVRKHKKDSAILDALDKKIQRLKVDPHATGGHLGGQLHGKRATRIMGKLRLVFRIVETEHAVYLEGLDHRKHDYEHA